MEEKLQKRREFLSQLLPKLDEIKNVQQSLIEKLAGVQSELMSAGEDSLSSKVGEVFSNESKNQEALKKILDDLEMELNRLRNQ